MSKVLLLNGSPNAKGCTAEALNEMIQRRNNSRRQQSYKRLRSLHELSEKRQMYF